MRTTTEATLARLRTRRAQLEARAAQLQARAKTLERKIDTRKKILLGAAVMTHAAKNANFKAYIDRLLDAYLTRDDDRRLFSLPPK